MVDIITRAELVKDISHLPTQKRVLGMQTKIFINSIEVSEDWFRLTPRQREIVADVVRGFSNREIAGNNHITEQTVKDHLHNVYLNLGVRSRTELVSRIFGLRVC